MVRTSGSVSIRPRTSAASLYRSWLGSVIPDSGMSLAMIAGGNAGDPVGDGEPGLPVVDSRRILQRRFGFDGAEGDDLRDPVVAPLVGCVAHHLTAAPVVEVDIDVGHRGALGVEEPLEQQTVWNRVDVGDAQRVGDQRAGGRAAAGTHPCPPTARS